MTADSSPEFSPSILHNKKGPLNPSYRAGDGSTGSSNGYTVMTPYIPLKVGRLLHDKRFLTLICIFLPPFAVFLKTGFSKKFSLSLLLFAFFIFPGTIGPCFLF